MEVCKEITNKVLMPCLAEPEDQKNAENTTNYPKNEKSPVVVLLPERKWDTPCLQMQEPQNHSKTKKYRKESK
ncbi:hypothetical protein KsCSTR_49050 [Candidatus Kuenenia stuttgartiensis]|uniref:Uncharacterized protein n=1 Tax=Kuenenia stuttgartiensis TaxID=174633 RepID=A0A6G7GY55_KUEST|nr:hypothetical protein [Candidatus Kuenenia stuttgartiensis]QII14282.1 hypothetical protein KsCSTR_49050 [Candidatus Kuenenia stuttgartiensis]GJQ50584.1 MAG: hypothetical protein HKUEN01_29700 [Candidatus Kuenenia stuttgartiensis]